MGADRCSAKPIHGVMSRDVESERKDSSELQGMDHPGAVRTTPVVAVSSEGVAPDFPGGGWVAAVRSIEIVPRVAPPFC
jgi:hypothetical protein